MSRIQFWSNNRGCAAYEAAGIDWLIAHLEAERDAARLGCARLRKHNIDASARIVALEADRAELLDACQQARAMTPDGGYTARVLDAAIARATGASHD